MHLMLYRTQKPFVHSFPKQGDPSLPGGDAQPGHSPSSSPHGPPIPAPPSRGTYLSDLSTLSSLPEGLAPGDSFLRRKIPSRFFMSLALEGRASLSRRVRGWGDTEQREDPPESSPHASPTAPRPPPTPSWCAGAAGCRCGVSARPAASPRETPAAGAWKGHGKRAWLLGWPVQRLPARPDARVL